MENKSINKDVIEAINLLAHGKRNILCGEVRQAVSQLQEACRILGREYGELADECADAYLWYGKALLDLSRKESGVLGDVIPEVESEDSESSDDESSDRNSSKDSNESGENELDDGVLSEDLEEEELGGIKGGNNLFQDDIYKTYVEDVCLVTMSGAIEAANESNDISKVQKALHGNSIPNEDDNHDCTKHLPTISQKSDDMDKVAGCSRSEVSDIDDISNLQLAWEMLELSKLIYQRHDHNDLKLKLAETYLKLGEIGMETEQYEQAIIDFKECLQIQQQILQPEDRRLAETLYQLGLVCTYDRQYDCAIGYYHGAVDVIRSKIDHLSKIVAEEIPPDLVENSDGFYTPLELAQKEIEELHLLLPDISTKIDDVRDEQSEAEKVKQLMQETVGPSPSLGCGLLPEKINDGGSTSSIADPPTTSQQMINNISHLVRKKRKSEGDTPLQTKRQKVNPAHSEQTSGSSSILSSDDCENPVTIAISQESPQLK